MPVPVWWLCGPTMPAAVIQPPSTTFMSLSGSLHDRVWSGKSWAPWRFAPDLVGFLILCRDDIHWNFMGRFRILVVSLPRGLKKTVQAGMNDIHKDPHPGFSMPCQGQRRSGNRFQPLSIHAGASSKHFPQLCTVLFGESSTTRFLASYFPRYGYNAAQVQRWTPLAKSSDVETWARNGASALPC